VSEYELGRDDAVLIRFERVERTTRLAYGLQLGGDCPLVWLPRSQVKVIDEGNGHAYVPKWWADQEEIPYE
jgi:hypothetical protein